MDRADRVALGDFERDVVPVDVSEARVERVADDDLEAAERVAVKDLNVPIEEIDACADCVLFSDTVVVPVVEDV